MPDLALTGLLALQCFIPVVAAPIAAMEFVGGRALIGYRDYVIELMSLPDVESISRRPMLVVLVKSAYLAELRYKLP